MTSLKEKTISGLIWSFFDNSSNQVTQFIIGVILARLLSPKDFGVIGMIMIFIGISQALTEGGLRYALIRKQNCSEEDYNTVFYTSFFIGCFLYALLFFSSPYIAQFYNEPLLKEVIRVLAIYIIIDSLGNVQGAILIKNVNFKLRTKITFIANLISGSFGVFFALIGYGVWSLIIRQLIQASIFIFFLWYWSNWRPKIIFKVSHLKELLEFSLPLLATNLLETIYNYSYYLIIGKFYSATELGYYTRAASFASLPTTNINGITDRVIYPILSTLQNDEKELKQKSRMIAKHLMLIIFFLSALMIGAAKSIVLILIGTKWLPSVIYFQLLCIAFMLIPMLSLNNNIIKVKGETKIIFKIELIRKISAIPIIILGIFGNIELLIIGMILHSVISFFFYSYHVEKIINYKIKEQFADISLSMLVSSIVFVSVYGLNALELSSLHLLLVQVILGFVLFTALCKIFQISEYYSLKTILISKLIKGEKTI